ncbi:MAG: hypothetical protein CME61_00470 [Halobacteriovoraceae bacterium]|nr:hypothetical protein [Halobacteriovoraceae bacterium]
MSEAKRKEWVRDHGAWVLDTDLVYARLLKDADFSNCMTLRTKSLPTHTRYSSIMKDRYEYFKKYDFHIQDLPSDDSRDFAMTLINRYENHIRTNHLSDLKFLMKFLNKLKENYKVLPELELKTDFSDKKIWVAKNHPVLDIEISWDSRRLGLYAFEPKVRRTYALENFSWPPTFSTSGVASFERARDLLILELQQCNDFYLYHAKEVQEEIDLIESYFGVERED